MSKFSDELINEVFNYLNDWLILNTGNSLADRIPELFDDGEYDEILVLGEGEDPSVEAQKFSPHIAIRSEE